MKHQIVKDLVNLAKRFSADDVLALASQLSYSLLLAFFPFLIFLLTLAGFSPISGSDVLSVLKDILPINAFALIQNTIIEVFDTKNTNLLSLSLIITIWTASSGFNAVIKGLNKAYDENEKRSYFRVQLVAVLCTIALTFIIILTVILLVFGETIWTAGIKWLGFSTELKYLWDLIRYIIIMLSMVFIFAALYHFTPSRRLNWKDIMPGALFSTAGWLIASFGFAFYVNHFGNYSMLYGSIGAVIILLTWLFITSIIIILGGEINAVLAFDREGIEKFHK
ncbi:YihY/virulence factor BrkB family protein [Clostridium sp. JN-9]|uniref:YihY/virulence factor BrkB family protein n=1 Tax=Clostridium sp. JN-9 TaxID=2507159 RepID=UPI000FFE0E3A|nr:YihY/virulence factor BrkB family protein [Clostridium sp. JN-9]QAT41278.1 YihY/virulence factor BrkB family protein [Clostridium sp. JN-9]